MNSTILRVLAVLLGANSYGALAQSPKVRKGWEDSAGNICVLLALRSGQLVNACRAQDPKRPKIEIALPPIPADRGPVAYNLGYFAKGKGFTGRGYSNSVSIHKGDDFADSAASLQLYLSMMRTKGWAFVEAPHDAPHMATVFPEKGGDFRVNVSAYLDTLVGLTEKLIVQNNALASENDVYELNDAFRAVSVGAVEGRWKVGDAWCVVLQMLALQHGLQESSGHNWPLPATNVAYTAGWAMQMEDAMQRMGINDVKIIDKTGHGLLNAAGKPIKKGDLVTVKGHSHLASVYGFLQRLEEDDTISTKVITIDGNFGPIGEEGVKYVIRDASDLIGHIDVEMLTLAALDIREDAKMQQALAEERRREMAAAAIEKRKGRTRVANNR